MGYRGLAVAAAIAIGGFCVTPALAEAAGRHVLFFSGVDASTLSLFSWAGAEATIHPRHLTGPLLRVMGGAGSYDYEKDDAPDGKVLGDVTIGEALVGWRQIGTTLCVTVLGGFAIEDHRIDVPDPENRVQGTETGVRISAELFWRPSPRTHIEASTVYATTFDSWRVHLAGGYALWRGITLGPEAEAFGNVESNQVRLGLFVSDIAWRTWRFKASGGGLFNDEESGAYGRLGMEWTF